MNINDSAEGANKGIKQANLLLRIETVCLVFYTQPIM